MNEESTHHADHEDGPKPGQEVEPKPARKAAKKAARKAAKSTARKSAVQESQDDAQSAARSEAKVERGDPEAGRQREPEASDNRDDENQARFGRVPGGGPVQRDGEGDVQGTEKAPVDGDSRDPRGDDSRGNRDDRGNRNDRGGRDDREGGQRERRRRRRKRRRGDRDGGPAGDGGRSDHRERQDDRERGEGRDRSAVLEGPKVEVEGLFEIAPKGFGFLRLPEKNFEQARDDVFVTPELVRMHGLRLGVWLKGWAQQGSRGPQLVEISSVNGMDPAEARRLPAFEELKAVNPNKRISFETEQNRYTTRVLDLVSPVGRGQRGLIVSPPRSGKTTLLLHLAEAVQELHDESLHLMVLLVDERPEEVTEFRRCLPGAELFASSNDDSTRNHTRIAELCIERAKRLVEAGKHVFLLMDSITRLARAYNGATRGGKGRGIGSGGIMVGALETPRRLFAAARNTREAGSLTILATALIQTNSRADDAIFQEFKGTGNMELVLDRKIAENYVYPAVDIFKSGTRREELLLPDHTLHKIHMIRRGLSGHRPLEAMERLSFFLKKFPNNPQMLLEIKG